MIRQTGLALATAALCATGMQAQEMEDMADMTGHIHEAGAFTTPGMADMAGPLTPGHAYEVSFEAAPGTHLSLATMFVQSNDWFYATAPGGVALFDEMGQARTGDITSEISLWDAGTEADQAAGEGADQAPRQSGPDMGADDSNRLVRGVDGMMYDGIPATSQALRVTLATDGMGMDEVHRFTLRIQNLGSDVSVETMSGAVPFVLSPGLWVVHGPSAEPLFTPQSEDRGEGLEALAEDGDPSALVAYLNRMAGM